MIWRPSHLTRNQMEERRRRGAQLLKQDRLLPGGIARPLGANSMAVSHWARQLEEKDLRGIKQRRATGRPARLTRPQRTVLLRILRQDAVAAGFATERWTLSRIQQVIARQFEVRYHPNYLSRRLRQWGWSPQQPVGRAVEREEELVRAWLQKDWPRIKKSAAARRRNRFLR